MAFEAIGVVVGHVGMAGRVKDLAVFIPELDGGSTRKQN